MKFASKYVAAIKYLVANPDELYTNWNFPHCSPAGCLFMGMGKLSMFTEIQENDEQGVLGCATLVKRGTTNNGYTKAFAEIPQLTAAIRASTIPTTEELKACGERAEKNRKGKRELKKTLEQFAFVQTVCDFLFQRT